MLRTGIACDPVSMRQHGFTLIEIICVLCLLALIASIAFPRIMDLDDNASRQALKSAVAELNSRENLAWSLIKLSGSGWVDDVTLFSQVDTNLGVDYRWSPSVAVSGGAIQFRNQTMVLRRNPSSAGQSGNWRAN